MICPPPSHVKCGADIVLGLAAEAHNVIHKGFHDAGGLLLEPSQLAVTSSLLLRMIISHLYFSLSYSTVVPATLLHSVSI